MKRKPYLYISVLFIIMILSFSAGQKLQLRADENEYYLKIQDALTNFQNVYKQINMHYVEEIDPYEFVRSGIDGMLDKLDPYTVFIDPEGDLRLKIITTGKYGGLGMEIGMRNNRITIISPMSNSPASRAGFKAGDMVEKIDGEDVSKYNSESVSEKLRGPIGTDVEITIRRPGFDELITKKLTREEISIDDVTYFDFVAPGIAYVRLTGFTDKATMEVLNAINELKNEQNIEGFILDLRGNSGGLLESAVEISNIFLPQDTPVVSTNGFRENEFVFRTRSRPVLPDIPVAVLVDEGSASASEIVAGALQDLDRAIIVGTETFGKGLVQKVFTVDKERRTKIKITTAKYYIPSGRCIQKTDYSNNNKVFYKQDSLFSDSHVAEFFTANKRLVYEKGGISPDIHVGGEEVHNVLIELWRKSILFNFAVEYQRKNPQLKSEFAVGDDIFNQFVDYVAENKFDYIIEGENEAIKLAEAIGKNELLTDLKNQTNEIINELDKLKEKDLINHKDEIQRALLSELAEKYFGPYDKIRYEIQDDKQLNAAVEVLNNQNQYKKILAIK